MLISLLKKESALVSCVLTWEMSMRMAQDGMGLHGYCTGRNLGDGMGSDGIVSASIGAAPRLFKQGVEVVARCAHASKLLLHIGLHQRHILSV
jgi:hypothetical protein